MLLGPSRRLVLYLCTSVFGAAGSKSKLQIFRRYAGEGSAGVEESCAEAVVPNPPLRHDSIAPFSTGAKAYTTPLPPQKKISGRPFTSPSDDDAHEQWKIFGAMCSWSRATRCPVRLSSTTRLGASGARTRLWVLSTPVAVLR